MKFPAGAPKISHPQGKHLFKSVLAWYASARVAEVRPLPSISPAAGSGRRFGSVAASHCVEGFVSRGFEAVREAFVENFARRRELGGACSAYYHGEKVVDLWGGIRNMRTGE